MMTQLVHMCCSLPVANYIRNMTLLIISSFNQENSVRWKSKKKMKQILNNLKRILGLILQSGKIKRLELQVWLIWKPRTVISLLKCMKSFSNCEYLYFLFCNNFTSIWQGSKKLRRVNMIALWTKSRKKLGN